MSAQLLVQLMLRQVGRHSGPLQPPSWLTASMAKRLVTLLQSAEVTTAMLEDDIELEFLSAWFEERLGQEQAIFDQALGQGKGRHTSAGTRYGRGRHIERWARAPRA